MARIPSETDLDSLNDGQLRDLIQNAKAALAERIQTRLDEIKNPRSKLRGIGAARQ